MTATEAMQQVKDDMIPGVRGVGCAVINMVDGREYCVESESEDLVARYSDNGDLIERVDASSVSGDVLDVDWSVDELGGVFCR